MTKLVVEALCWMAGIGSAPGLAPPKAEVTVAEAAARVVVQTAAGSR